MLETMDTLVNLLLIVGGFSLIIFAHELGHFAAARWARVRVLAFAMGFGPAVLSYRKGMGLRRGSSEAAYRKLARERGDGRGLVPGVSPTEYRLNALPLGGYVKMLGQDDADPSHRSDAPDSYNAVSVPKRMVIISAGVLVNLVTAALLFVVVFWFGLKIEPARIGFVEPGSPAALATPVSPDAAPPGLMIGDTITAIDGEPVDAFKDVMVTTLMAAPGREMTVTVARPGTQGTLDFRLTPREDQIERILTIGVLPASSGTLLKVTGPRAQADFELAMSRLGLPPTLKPGMSLVSIGGQGSVNAGRPLEFQDLRRAVSEAGGRSVEAVFAHTTPAGHAQQDAGTQVRVELVPVVELQTSRLLRPGQASAGTSGERTLGIVSHLAGLVPVMAVAEVADEGRASGLAPRDVFARIGDTEFPSQVQGLREIRAPGLSSITIDVLREVDGQLRRVALGKVPVRDGRVGFATTSTAAQADVPAALATLVTGWPTGQTLDRGGKPAEPPPGATLRVMPGSSLRSVDGVAVASYAQARAALAEAARAGRTSVPLVLELPRSDGSTGPNGPTTESLELALDEPDRQELLALGWEPPIPGDLFEPVQSLLKREGPIAAIGQGLHETKTMILQTYVTFVRLFQGSVKVEQLRGPVGIAHAGTIIAQRGWVWVLFFMAAVSINLAVVNFLPLPVVDGGHFVFLCYEWIVGRPVSVAFQNIATLAGLALIALLFVVTTFNDVTRLFGS
jgi:regulator of sigma E protease